MKVIGTAGHVDHGKSTLVRALTGIDPDRLKEEKAREMTIDLGFAWLELPGGETAGIIDVPGHKDFIENMVAGVGAIDAAMLVIDANEGFMPQTREHLAILDQLQVPNGVIVLTKCDLVTDPGWIDLITSDIRQEVKCTFLSNAPIIAVSAKTGKGIPELKDILGSILKDIPPARDIKKPRLSVDRVFSIQGYGTVVTGTLLDGRLQTGDELSISSGEKHGRIRGLQSHNKKLDEALPGSRVAINLSGVDAKDIKRGDLLNKEIASSSLRIDAWVQVIPSTSRPLKHNDSVKFFHLAFECSARVRLLGKDEILPGEDGFIQLELSSPLQARVKDRFILRYPSPSETIGGGEILKTCVQKKYRRFSGDEMAKLSIIHSGSLEETILGLGSETNFFSIKDTEYLAEITTQDVIGTIEKLIIEGRLINLDGDKRLPANLLLITNDRYTLLSNKLIKFLSDYHEKFPLRFGVSRDEILRSLIIDRHAGELLLNKLVGDFVIKQKKDRYSLADFVIFLKPEQKKALEKLDAVFNLNPFSPPDYKTIMEMIGPELMQYVLTSGEMVQVSPDVVFRRPEYDRMLSFVYKTIQEIGQLSVTELRDTFSSSRKYALAFLEFLDASGITIREGDYRKLKNINKEQA